MDSKPEHIMYLIEKRFESTTNRMKEIQQYLVSLVDRILKVILDGSETHPWPLPSSDNFLN